MSDQSKNQKAWADLFASHNILDHLSQSKLFKIKSSQINVYRESRLMTKFDNTSQLPTIFTDNDLGLLPISRGEYVLGKFRIFHKFEQLHTKVVNFNFQNNYESLDFNNITSESTAINCAYVSGILQDFLGEDIVPTVSGRMGSNAFSFDVKDNSNLPLNIDVNKAQIEIDAGFESPTSLILIEAKNFISEDFIIRQLYYPLRRWSGSLTKKVKTVYLTYTNGIFELREYEFANIHEYNSISLIKIVKYSISHLQINIQSIEQLIKITQVTSEPAGIPFPQADSFERVINLCELLSINEILTKPYITENYDFDDRQTDYYVNAGRYLGLIDRSNIDGQVSVYLTEQGKAVFNKPIIERSIILIEILLSKKVFREVLILNFKNAELPTRDKIKEIMRDSNLYKVNAEETYHRRASTVIGWVNWIVNQIEE